MLMLETQEIKKVEMRLVAPVLETLNKTLWELLKKNLPDLEVEVNTAIERGVKTDETSNDANTASDLGHKGIRVVTEVRLQYTRQIDAVKKEIMRDVEAESRPLVNSLKILDELRFERSEGIRLEKERIKRETEEKQRAIDEAARKEEERRKNISLAQGGNGNFKPVERETIVQPVEQIGMRDTARTKRIIDHDAIKEAVERGVREIPGVHIFQIWTYKVVDSKSVPQEYRKTGRG